MPDQVRVKFAIAFLTEMKNIRTKNYAFNPAPSVLARMDEARPNHGL